MMDREKVNEFLTHINEFIVFMVVLMVMLTGTFGLPVAAYFIVQHQSSAAFELATSCLLISGFFWYAVLSKK